MATTEHHAQPSHHERHHRTLRETIHGQDKINGAESVSSSRSSSSDDEPAAQTTTDDTSHVHGETSKAGATSSIAYDITLNCRSSDPIADSHNLDPEELPSHWVPTVLSHVTRATSTAFGQLTSPRHSTSSHTQQQHEENNENEAEEGHILPRLTLRNPWEESFLKPGIKGILAGGLKWGLPDSYAEGSGKGSKRSSGFKSSKKIQRQLEIARQEDRELGEDWDHVDVIQPEWGWPSGHLQKEVDELRQAYHEAYPSQAEHDTHKQDAKKGTEADYKAKEKSQQDWSDPKTPSRGAARVTWLGHATTLLQLPPLSTAEGQDSRSISILFDPIFSERCSPYQSAGPQRFTPAPCSVKDLPPIDFVVISHSHYDHLDYHTFKQLHHSRGDKIHAFVPLGVKDKISGGGGFGWKRERVSELDWWDHARISLPSSDTALKIHCTPVQHGSGRGAGDKDSSLWASWVVEWTTPDSRFCTFFAGDTGLKYHYDNPYKRAKYPACPAFSHIATKCHLFDLLLLPISVGSSLSYFRSWDPFPRAFSPFPRVSSTLTSSIHMDPHDAVECHQIFQQNSSKRKAMEKVEQERLKGVEAKEGEQDVFLVADQGKTVWLPIRSSSS